MQREVFRIGRCEHNPAHLEHCAHHAPVEVVVVMELLVQLRSDLAQKSVRKALVLQQRHTC